MTFSLDQIESALKLKNYIFFDGGDYDVNIVGVRNVNFNNKVTNKFDDEIHLIYRVGSKWYNKIYPITTDPGTYYMNKPLDSKGTVILVPKQYRKSYALGYHLNKYKALVQVGYVEVYRDNNKDDVYDFVGNYSGMYGINIHKAGIDSSSIDNWSSGCQVFKRQTDFNDFIKILEKSAEIWGNKFTYTLLTSKDI